MNSPNPFSDTLSQFRKPTMDLTFQMPTWADAVKSTYESNASNQFILHGNVNDNLVVTSGESQNLSIGNLLDFMLKTALLHTFDVILTYDLGTGIRVEKGQQVWVDFLNSLTALNGKPVTLPRTPRLAIECLTDFVRWEMNRVRGSISSATQTKPNKIGIVIKAAHLVLPAGQTGINYDLSALASLIREWTTDTAIRNYSVCTCLITEAVNSLHDLVIQNSRATKIEIPLPTKEQIKRFLQVTRNGFSQALSTFYGVRSAATGEEWDNFDQLAGQLVGVTLCELESLLRQREYKKKPIINDDLIALKKAMIEKDADGLIEFFESDKTLNDWNGPETIRTWLKKDIELWTKGDVKSVPMGYLLAAPIGCGKNFLMSCIAGEAGVPVITVKNFRGMYQGQTESRQEKIIRLLKALGRCIVFFDEADQSMGKRNTEGDGGVSGRVYANWASEMSNPKNRGKIQWWLASSRSDLIEPDIKRPGRVDVVIPLFPSANPAEGFGILKSLCGKNDVELWSEDYEALKPLIPELLTPGAAEAIAVKARRYNDLTPVQAVARSLKGYQAPVKYDVLLSQIKIAVDAATDVTFVPDFFAKLVGG